MLIISLIFIKNYVDMTRILTQQSFLIFLIFIIFR